jgi:hypothetical protein
MAQCAWPDLRRWPALRGVGVRFVFLCDRCERVAGIYRNEDSGGRIVLSGQDFDASARECRCKPLRQGRIDTRATEATLVRVPCPPFVR